MDTGSLSAVLGLSGQALEFLARQSLYAAAVAVVVWTVLAIVRPRHPVLHLALWWLVLARLVLPADLSTPWSLRASAENLLTAIVWPSGAPHVNVVGGEGSVPVRDATPAAPAGAEVLPDAAALPAVEATAAATGWLPLAVFLFWLGGAAAMALLLARAERSARHAIAMAEEANEPLPQQLVEAWAKRFRVSRRVRLLVTPEATAPFTAGLFRPVIVLPRTLIDRLDAVEMSAVIGHEMSHIRSFDVAWRMAERVLLVLFFFHPLVWMAVRRIDTAREAACDVAAANSGMVARSSYAKGLLAALKAFRIEPETAFARTLSIQGGTSDGLKARLVWLKGETAMSTRSKLLGTIGIVGLGMLVLPMAQARDTAPVAAPAPARVAAPAPVTPAPAVQAVAAPEAPDAPAVARVPVPPSVPATAARVAVPEPAPAPLPPVAPAAFVESIDQTIEASMEAADLALEAQLAAAEARREAEEAAREARLEAEAAAREARLEFAQLHRDSLQAQAEARREADAARRESLEKAAVARREALQDAANARREARLQAERARRESSALGMQAQRIRSEAMQTAVNRLRQSAHQMRTNPDMYVNNGNVYWSERWGARGANSTEEVRQIAAELEAEANRLEREMRTGN